MFRVYEVGKATCRSLIFTDDGIGGRFMFLKEVKIVQRILSLSFAAVLLCFLVTSDSSGADIKNPLVHWALDGDGKDSVGGSDLSIEGGDFEEGKYGQALSLDGSGAHAVDEGGADYINGLDAITIAVWIKSNQTNTDKGFIICLDPNDKDKTVNIRYDAAGSVAGGTNVIKTGILVEGGVGIALESSEDVQTTEWQHVAIVWSSGEPIKLYINGVEDAPTFDEGPIDGRLDGLTKVIIGKGAKDQSGGWDGLIDDVYIYAEALSANEIAEVMNGDALSVDARGKLPALWGEMKGSN